MHNLLFNKKLSISILNVILPLIIIYLIAGTIAQKYMGLYESTQLFFYAPVFWLGFIPLPGMSSLIGIMTLALTWYLFAQKAWKAQTTGTLISHMGIVLLLVGGLLTGLFSQDGYMDLGIGETSNTVSDYHKRDFVIQSLDGTIKHIINHEDLEVGQTLSFENIPLSVTIQEFCKNCQIVARQDNDESFIGMAKHMSLTPKELEPQNEENLSGLTFRVTDQKDNSSTHVVLEGIPKLPIIETNDISYQFSLNKEQRSLPFSVELIDFKKDTHPGTTMAKAYQSRIRINDQGTVWESLISMNEPFRYKGYSFFQSSFAQTPNGNRSILSVVKNIGRSFPYIAGIIICFGLLIHLFNRQSQKD